MANSSHVDDAPRVEDQVDNKDVKPTKDGAKIWPKIYHFFGFQRSYNMILCTLLPQSP